MKTKRHEKILQLLAEHDIETQEDLLGRLRDSGFSVTQATVSRDIRELRLIKVQGLDGGYKYAINSTAEQVDLSLKFHGMFRDSVGGVDWAGNMVVIKCYVGMANAVCAALDSIHWDGVVGTLAGDDTIFCLMRTAEAAAAFAQQMIKLLK